MKQTLTLLLLSASALPLSAQHIHIKGKVTDSHKGALIGASIAVYKQDSILLGGVFPTKKASLN